MSVYGDLSKPQRGILRSLLQGSAVSIETAHFPGHSARCEPYVRLAELGLIECRFFEAGYYRRPVRAWLTSVGQAMLRDVCNNRASSRYSRFNVSHGTSS